MSKCGCIALLLLFGAAVSNSIGLYPNVILENTGTPAVTVPSNLFIYNWPQEEQVRRSGNITAIEYCFERKTNASVQPVFTLILLKSLSYGYRVSKTIHVTTQNFNFCSNRGGIDTCCERKALNQRNWFHIPSDIVAFGISATADNTILGCSPWQQRSAMGFQVSIDVIRFGYIGLPKSDMITVDYRMFNFVIETWNSSITTPSSNSSSTSTGQGPSQSPLPLTDTISIATTNIPNSPSMSAATDSEIDRSATTSMSAVTSSVSRTSSVQELPTSESTSLFPVVGQNSSSVIIVASVIAGCIFVLLHIIILVVVIYVCYRTRAGQKSENVESLTTEQLNQIDQPTYESVYAMPTCTASNEPEEETDQCSTYESSNYTLPTGTKNQEPAVFFDRNPAYGYHHDKLDSLEEPKSSNIINRGLEEMASYTKILPPSP